MNSFKGPCQPGNNVCIGRSHQTVIEILEHILYNLDAYVQMQRVISVMLTIVPDGVFLRAE